MPDEFVNMREVNQAADVLCATFGEENRERFRLILFLGVDAYQRKMKHAATSNDVRLPRPD